MSRRARILALMTDGFGGYGGVAQYNRDLLTALSQTSSVGEIVVVPRLGAMADRQLPSGVRQLPPIFNRAGYALRALAVALAQGPFDVVLCGHLAHAPLAAPLAWALGVPLWLQIHGIDAWTCPPPWVRQAVERADLVTAVSRYTRRRLLAWAHIHPEKVRVLPNTVSDRYAPGPKPAHVVERLGLRGKRVLLTVSRISLHDWYKGHHRVLDVMPDLLRAFPDLVYVIAGDGDGRERLQRLAGDRGVGMAVKFIGRVSDADLPDLYRAADVFVMPSTGEGFGIVFLEALRSGIPVVAGNGDGSVDPLRDGKAGYAVSCDDREALLDAIRSALERPRVSTHEAGIFGFASFARHCSALVDGLLGAPLH